MKPYYLIALLLISGLQSGGVAASDTSSISVKDAWARTTVGRTISAAAYMTLVNQTGADDTLHAVSSAVAETTMLHQSSENADGVMTMDHVHMLPLAAGAQVDFAPGGYHIMLIRLHEPLAEGQTFTVTLTFEKAGEITVPVQVTGITGPK